MLRLSDLSVLKDIADELSNLERCAQAFPEILTQEEEAVIQHDISYLEKVGLAKQEFLDSLKKSLERSAELFASLQQDKELPKSFSEMKNKLNEFVTLTSESTLHDRGLFQLTNKIKQSLESLIALYSEIKPKIEKNRFIIARLLHHHQESYRFWSELKKENSSNYNSKGAKKSQSTISQVFAKA